MQTFEIGTFNKTSQDLSISVHSEKYTEANIELFNKTGQLIQRFYTIISKGENQVSFPLSYSKEAYSLSINIEQEQIYREVSDVRLVDIPSYRPNLFSLDKLFPLGQLR